MFQCSVTHSVRHLRCNYDLKIPHSPLMLSVDDEQSVWHLSVCVCRASVDTGLGTRAMTADVALQPPGQYCTMFTSAY